MMWLMMALFSLIFLFIEPPKQPDDPPAWFFTIFMVVFSFIYLLFGLPSIVAGMGLLKRKKWAKTWGIIAGVLSGMSFPIGTAVCVYTFWFFFSDPGKFLYDEDYAASRWSTEAPRGLYDAPTAQYRSAQEQTSRREYDFNSQSQPPNWRD